MEAGSLEISSNVRSTTEQSQRACGSIDRAHRHNIFGGALGPWMNLTYYDMAIRAFWLKASFGLIMCSMGSLVVHLLVYIVIIAL